MAFHDIRFPLALGRRAAGGPERRTQIVALASGHEERNQQWADSRRRYDAGIGLRSITDIHMLVAFFEARRGRMHGFRWRDPVDWKSSAPKEAPAATDIVIGIGDGTATTFPLIKTYGTGPDAYARAITKPVAGTVKVALDLAEQAIGFSIDHMAGTVTFSSAPGSGVAISAGYEFDVPVRFDSDRLDIDLAGFEAGSLPSVPVIEIKE